VLQLVEAGRLDLDAPVARYWRPFGVHGKGDITVRELLAHTSGLPTEVPMAHVADANDVLREATDVIPSAAPGVRVIYSDVNFIVLAKLVERASGEPFDAYCQHHIFTPLGMVDTGFRPGAALAGRIAPTSGLARGGPCTTRPPHAWAALRGTRAYSRRRTIWRVTPACYCRAARSTACAY
jgi:CubicO group peptidase (beta-lactamase class C family)